MKLPSHSPFVLDEEGNVRANIRHPSFSAWMNAYGLSMHDDAEIRRMQDELMKLWSENPEGAFEQF